MGSEMCIRDRHELLEFRRIAATIYKKHKRWEKSIQLSKADKMYKDAIDTCSASGDPALAEDLLRFFVDVCDKECFCATLYTCYKIVTPDVALELAWRSDYVDFAMPYVIQYARHLHDTIAELEKRTAPKEEPTESEQAQAAAAAMYGAVWKSTSASGAPDNSSLSHFSAMTRPSWLGRAARNRHRHAIEQASRRWRGGRRGDSGRTRRKILISTQVWRSRHGHGGRAAPDRLPGPGSDVYGPVVRHGRGHERRHGAAHASGHAGHAAPDAAAGHGVPGPDAPILDAPSPSPSPPPLRRKHL